MLSEIWISVGSIILLLLLSAFFSGSETALTAASRARIHQLSKEGNKNAKIVEKLNSKREHLIGTILLANNLVNILASALATSILIGMFGNAGIGYATATMTLLILIFAEVLPKTYAINKANRAAIFVAPLIRFLVVVFSPITNAIQLIVKFILNPFRVPSSVDAKEKKQELLGTIDLHASDQNKDSQEKEMLKSILELENVEVGEIMVHRKEIFMINCNLSAEKIMKKVIESPYTRIPLWKNKQENIIGVLHVKNILAEFEKSNKDVKALDFTKLSSKPWFIPESTSLLKQLQMFRYRHEHFALVVDEYGTLMGVVTLEDILEEIVGEISDEFDTTELNSIEEKNGSYLVNGETTLRDLNRLLSWSFPINKATTVAGHIINETRSIPEIGQIFSFENFRFEILEKKHNQIKSIKITPPKEQNTSKI